MDIENKTINLEDTSNWTEEDFKRVVGEYQKRRKSIPNLTPTKKTGKTLRKVVGIGLVIGMGTAIYGIGIKNYSKIEGWLKPKYESAIVKILGQENRDNLKRIGRQIDDYAVKKLSDIADDLGIQYDK